MDSLIYNVHLLTAAFIYPSSAGDDRRSCTASRCRGRSSKQINALSGRTYRRPCMSPLKVAASQYDVRQVDITLFSLCRLACIENRSDENSSYTMLRSPTSRAALSFKINSVRHTVLAIAFRDELVVIS